MTAITACTPDPHRSTIRNNRASQGGGIANSFGTTTVQSSTIEGNYATVGGGLVNDVQDLSVLQVFDSTVSFNHAVQDGGGLANVGAAHCQRSTYSHNTAHRGGGIFHDSPQERSRTW